MGSVVSELEPATLRQIWQIKWLRMIHIHLLAQAIVWRDFEKHF